MSECEKIKQNLTNSMIMKNIFIAQRFDKTKQVFHIVVFPFEIPALPSRSMKNVEHTNPNSGFGGPYQNAHTHSAPSPLARAKWIYDGRRKWNFRAK